MILLWQFWIALPRPFLSADLNHSEDLMDDVDWSYCITILIDEKVNDEGGHGYRVVERLVELGFSKKELMVLKFAESDIDRAMQEGEENV